MILFLFLFNILTCMRFIAVVYVNIILILPYYFVTDETVKYKSNKISNIDKKKILVYFVFCTLSMTVRAEWGRETATYRARQEVISRMDTFNCNLQYCQVSLFGDFILCYMFQLKWILCNSVFIFISDYTGDHDILKDINIVLHDYDCLCLSENLSFFDRFINLFKKKQ